MANYREDDGFLMFKDQHIEHVKNGRIEHHEHFYLQGSVKPEQLQTAQHYETWLLLCADGAVQLEVLRKYYGEEGMLELTKRVKQLPVIET